MNRGKPKKAMQTPNFISWTDDDLAAHKKTLDKQVGELGEEISTLKETLSHRNTLLENHKASLTILNQEMKDRGIDVFAERMKRKYKGNLSNKQWEKVFRKAWEDGHSYGEGEVENYLIDLVDLFED